MLLAMPALAAPQPAIIGTFGKWTAYRHFEGKNKPVCYIAAPPVKSEGRIKRRGTAFLLVTQRPAEKAFNVVSFVAGYDYIEKKPVMVKIDEYDFIMIASGDTAWTPNQKADDILTRAIKEGSKMTITGYSRKNIMTKDIFDLTGSAKALEITGKACKI